MQFIRRFALPLFAAGALVHTVRAQSAQEKLQVHGFLTQAGAESSNLPIYGIQKASSTDFRVAAIQLRYAMSEAGTMVIQLEHRRMGTSALTSKSSDVTLNWAFYQHRARLATVKVGRLPFSNGIYSGLRDVGTVLPFYRAPLSYYPDSYETIDGAEISSRLSLGHGFALLPEAYAGGLDFKLAIAIPPTGQMLMEIQARKAFGTQWWLETPLSGLRFGAGWASAVAQNVKYTIPHAAIDATFNQFFLRGELEVVSGHESGSKSRAYYAQGGVHLTSKLMLNAQAEFADQKRDIKVSGYHNPHRDLAGGMLYAFSSALVAKLEQHQVSGYGFDQFISPAAPRGKSGYTIASLSVSF